MTRVWIYVSAVLAALVAVGVAIFGVLRWRSRADLASQAEDLGREAAKRAEADGRAAVEAECRAAMERLAAGQERSRAAVDVEASRSGLGDTLRDLNRDAGKS